MLRDGRTLLFVFVWFAFNALSGLRFFSMPGMEESVAWQAHVGGFVAGLLGFTLLDPVRDAPMIEIPHGSDVQGADEETPSG